MKIGENEGKDIIVGLKKKLKIKGIIKGDLEEELRGFEAKERELRELKGSLEVEVGVMRGLLQTKKEDYE